MKKIILFFFLAVSLFAQSNSEDLLRLKSEVPELLQDNNSPQINFYEAQKKSKGLAIIYSLLLPGMGELYADSYNSGQYFTIAEGALWGFLIGFNSYGNWQEDNYKSYAASYAGADLEGKDEDYFSIISQYESIDQYNRAQELNRDFKETYDRNEFFWDWGSNERRRDYRDLWESSERAFNNVQFVIGGLILNRIASAINAVRLVNKYNNKLGNSSEWQLEVGMKQYKNLPPNLSFGIKTSF